MQETVRAWIASAASECGLQVTFLSPTDSRAKRRELAALFGDASSMRERISSESIGGGFAVQHPDSWRWPPEFVGTQDTVLLFADEHRMQELVAIHGSRDLLQLLENTPSFPFYICDLQGTYLIAVDHHDYLIAAGGARSWAEGLVKRHEAWVRSLHGSGPAQGGASGS